MKSQNNKNIKQKYDIRDLFIYIAFILIPLCFFIFNFVGLYRIFFYVILVVFILTYILINQFFFEDESVLRKDKKILALMIVNTIIVSLITLSGNSSSSYFFLLPVLLFLTSILLSFEAVILECFILLISVFASEIYHLDRFRYFLLELICKTG